MAPSRLLVTTVAVGLVLAGAPGVDAYPRPGETEVVNVAADGGPADADVAALIMPAVSYDARYVAFASAATNLVPGQDAPRMHIYVRDRRTGVTERVSLPLDGDPAGGGGTYPQISADGRYVAFQSSVSDLVEGVTNGVTDTYVHDRQTGVTERVSVASDGTQADRAAAWPSISGDGRYVAFASDATTLAPGITNGLIDVFVHDRVTRETVRVSVSADGEEINSRAQRPSISGDGRHVAFASGADNLVPEGSNGRMHVFVASWQDGTVERVSVSSDGEMGRHNSTSLLTRPAISGDGRYVAFDSAAWNLVPADTNGDTGAFLWEGFYEPGLGWDVFVRDRGAGTTERVSLTSDGRESDRDSAVIGGGAISADGRFVTLMSASSVFAEGTDDGLSDVYVHDRLNGTTERISEPVTAESNNASAGYPVLSGDGTHVAFQSRATTLTDQDTGGLNTLFLHHRGPGVGVGRLAAAVEDDAVSVSGWARFSGVTVATADADESLPGLAVVNADLAGADVVFRPEQEDLFVRLRLTAMQEWRDPRAGVGAAGPPGTVHGFAFTTDDSAWEVRMARRAPWTSPGAIRPPAGWPQTDVGLFRCEPACLHVADLHGGWGTAGQEVRFAIPLDLVGLAAGDAVTGLRAYAAAGDAASGDLATLDSVELGDAVLPVPTVRLGLTPAGAPEDLVAFDTEASLLDGWFSGGVDAASLAAGEHQAWARACLGEVCGSASTTFVR